MPDSKKGNKKRGPKGKMVDGLYRKQYVVKARHVDRLTVQQIAHKLYGDASPMSLHRVNVLYNQGLKDQGAHGGSR